MANLLDVEKKSAGRFPLFGTKATVCIEQREV